MHKLLSLLAGPCVAILMAASLAGANDNIRIAKEEVRKNWIVPTLRSWM